MTTQLTGTGRRTYASVFKHPVAHNLRWRHVRSMLESLAEVTEEGGRLKVRRNGHTLSLEGERGKDVTDPGLVLKIRRFLQSSGAAVPRPRRGGVRLFVVIDHRKASVYRIDEAGSAPVLVTTPADTGRARHLHEVDGNFEGRRKPESKAFYRAVVAALAGAQQVLIFGGGTGASSAMNRLMQELKECHPDIARIVIGAIVVDQHHLGEGELLDHARRVFALAPTRAAGAKSKPRRPGVSR